MKIGSSIRLVADLPAVAVPRGGRRRGRSPGADSRIREGCVIEKIDGKPIGKDADYYPLLSGKVGKKVALSVYDPASQRRFEEQVEPISYGERSELLYKRWIKRCQRTVDELSGGQIGYVHVRAMNSDSFREVDAALLGRCRDKKAVIIDCAITAAAGCMTTWLPC